ncbi:MAG TPA: PaaI family thioesterase [Gaiellaceae bacterium]|nr:PaaI family thioesterase [Gaiellaceae bacterium]
MSAPFGSVDANADARVRASFARQGVMVTLGAEISEVAAGHVSIALAPEPRLSQQDGYLHAGVTIAVLDSACGYAAMTLMPEGSDVLTVELKVNLLAPAAGDRLVAEGEVIRAGRTLTVCRGDAYAERGTERAHVATMLATIIRRSAG